MSNFIPSVTDFNENPSWKRLKKFVKTNKKYKDNNTEYKYYWRMSLIL